VSTAPVPEWVPRAHELALALSDVADELALARFGGPVPAQDKPDGSPVTEADRMIESALRQRIETVFPDHALMGEETGGQIAPDRPTWVLDPIDGTANFMRGIPVFASLIGVLWQGRSVVGVASAPALGERWDAAAGQGARRNELPIGVSAIGTVAEASVLHGALEWYRDDGLWDALGELADRAWTVRGFGDWWMHLLVAGGMAEAAFEPGLKPWDVAALECLVTEAGGRLADWRGGDPYETGRVLTTNGLVHDEMVAALNPAAS
jgi:histidinol-phosphatase